MSADDPSYGLHVAAYTGDVGEVERLLGDKEINVNLLHSNGSAPLYIAAQQGHEKVVEALLKHEDVRDEIQSTFFVLFLIQ